MDRDQQSQLTTMIWRQRIRDNIIGISLFTAIMAGISSWILDDFKPVNSSVCGVVERFLTQESIKGAKARGWQIAFDDSRRGVVWTTSKSEIAIGDHVQAEEYRTRIYKRQRFKFIEHTDKCS